MSFDIKKNTELLKLASITIKRLQKDKEELETKLEKLASAKEVAFSLYRDGSIVAEDLELYIKEAESKELSELSLIKEASAFSSSNNLNTFGLSSQNETIEKEYDIVSFLLEN